MIYTVTFNPAIDYGVTLGRFVTGQVNRTIGERYTAGGKGINVSMVLKNLGFASIMYGFTAGNTGKMLENMLLGQGYDTDFVRLSNGATRINVKIKAVSETEINGMGPTVTEGELQKFYKKLDALKADDILVLAGTILKGMDKNIYKDIVRNMHSKNVKTIVDASGDVLINCLEEKPFLIKPNIHELEEIFDVEITGKEQVEEYARELRRKGAKNVIVSMAEKGAILVDETDKMHILDAPKGEVKNSVGAGDAMVAGFIAGYLKSLDYEKAFKLAVAAGSASAFNEGFATIEEIEKYEM